MGNIIDDQAISRFWDNFIEKLGAYQVKPDVVRWYEHHAERYIKAYFEYRLTTHTPVARGDDIFHKTDNPANTYQKKFDSLIGNLKGTEEKMYSLFPTCYYFAYGFVPAGTTC